MLAGSIPVAILLPLFVMPTRMLASSVINTTWLVLNWRFRHTMNWMSERPLEFATCHRIYITCYSSFLRIHWEQLWNSMAMKLNCRQWRLWFHVARKMFVLRYKKPFLFPRETHNFCIYSGFWSRWRHSPLPSGPTLQIHVQHSTTTLKVRFTHGAIGWIWLWFAHFSIVCALFPRWFGSLLMRGLRNGCHHIFEGIY